MTQPRLGVEHQEHRRGPVQDGGNLAGPHARVDPRRDRSEPEQRGVEDGVLDARGKEQADHVPLGDPEPGEVAGHAIGRPVPGREGEAAPAALPVRLDVGLDGTVQACRLPQDRHHGLMLIRWNAHWHGGRRWYQGCREWPAPVRSYARDVLVALCGGVGAARMLSGLVRVVPPGDITAIVNVGDDMELYGLSICPDLDTVTYTLAGMDNRDTGWGVAGESWVVMDELARLGGEDWFRLGDRDLATHLFRTGRLRAGEPLSAVTAELARRRGIAVRLVPATDDPLRTRVALAEVSELGPPGTEVSFQDYFVRLHHDVAVRGVRFDGAGTAHPAPGVMDALGDAETIVVCPSNPVVSIGPVLAVPGVRDALVARRRRVVGVSPIVAGAALKGPADRLMAELGTEPSVVGVARLYAPWVGTLVVDVADASHAAAIEAEGVRCVVTPTVMSTPERAEALARAVVDAAG